MIGKGLEQRQDRLMIVLDKPMVAHMAVNHHRRRKDSPFESTPKLSTLLIEG